MGRRSYINPTWVGGSGRRHRRRYSTRIDEAACARKAVRHDGGGGGGRRVFIEQGVGYIVKNLISGQPRARSVIGGEQPPCIPHRRRPVTSRPRIDFLRTQVYRCSIFADADAVASLYTGPVDDAGCFRETPNGPFTCIFSNSSFLNQVQRRLKARDVPTQGLAEERCKSNEAARTPETLQNGNN